MSISVDLEFANARIKTLEKNLLTADKIIRLIDSADMSESLKILAENGYGDGLLSEDIDFDELLSREEEKAVKIFSELIPSGYGLETFLLQNDFHNAKSLYKSNITGVFNKRGLKPNGKFDIKKAIDVKNYESLPLEMRKAFESLDKAKEKITLTGFDIDLEFDQAYYREARNVLAKSKKSVLNEYYKSLIEYTNIKSFVRCKKIDAKIELFKKCFVEGGSLSFDRLKKLYDLSLEEISEKMKFSDWKEAFIVACESLVSFETFVDNALLGLVKKQKTEMFTPSPILGYYLGKLCEIKVVRTILTCKKNGADIKEIKARVRETYA